MQLKMGLYRTYKENTEQTKALRGKLHPYETKRLHAMKMQKVDCSYDELSEDNELSFLSREIFRTGRLVCYLVEGRIIPFGIT